MRMLLLRWCPEWLGGWLVQRKWGQRLLGMEEVERAPILWVDDSGGGWRHPPDWQEPNYADVGQHDVWKREMRVFLWRVWVLADEGPGAINLRDVGLSVDSRPQPVPRLWPVGGQVAEACRRLGFLRLARAAWPDADKAWLRTVWERHRSEVEKEAVQRAKAIELINATSAVPSRTSPEEAAREARLDCDLGPLDLPDEVVRQPLLPLQLTESEGTQQYTRSKRKP